MKKVIIALAMFFTLLASSVHAADYSAQLEELKALLEQCKRLEINTPYEKIGVSTFERFADYIAEDEKDGVSNSIMTYNHNAMQSIYANTKANLEAYLSGAKAPLSVPKYDMMKTYISGAGITDGKNNIISSGYGHFAEASDDIEYFQDFGAMNIQTETGPSNVIALPDWYYTSENKPEYYFDIVGDGADHALKIAYKSEKADGKYFRFSQSVKVKPSTTYSYKLSYKGKNVNDGAVTVQVKGGDLSSLTLSSVSNTWQDSGWQTFTTGSKDTSVSFTVKVSDICEELYIDDIIVKESSGSNLLENGNFEGEYDKGHISEIDEILVRAKKSNVSVSFLLQPMYFWRIPGCEDMYTSKTGYSYNINDPRAKAKIEQYLRTLIPIIAKYEAVRDICITNEPNFDTRTYPDFYNPKFREYLLGLYGDISTINQKYGTSYTTVEAITMPGEFSKSALFYDWICFNEDMLTEWNAWMASIIKEYTSKPVHCKIMNYLIPDENADRKELAYGVDAEKFDTFSDYAGNDATSSIGHTPTLTTKMMWYDYLSSVTGKPIYNSEDHFISDGSTTYSEAQKDTVRYNLWQGAIHGRTMSTMWVWARTYDSGSDLANSILTRPDCLAEAGYTSLDMMRNADDITKLSSQKPEVALFYSKTSRVFSDDYMEYLHRYYQALLYSGKRVGFVTETSLDKLSDYKYLVIPYVEYTTPEALAAVNSFIDNGGKVIYYADREGYFGSNYKIMSKDKFGNSIDNAKIESKGTRFSTRDTDEVATAFQNYFTSDRVRVKDNSTGKNAAKVEYVYEVGTDGNVLVNIVNHNESNKTVSVYLDGKKISEMKNVLTGEDMGGSYTLEQYVPLTLKLKSSTETPSKPENIKFNSNMLSWDNDDNAVTYKVYYTGDEGTENLIASTSNNYCEGSGYGVYKVVPENSNGVQGPAEMIAVNSQFDIKFNSVNLEGGANASVNVKNNSKYRQRAVIKIRNSAGKLSMCDVWLAPKEEMNFKASLAGITDSVTASVENGYNKDLKLTIKSEK